MRPLLIVALLVGLTGCAPSVGVYAPTMSRPLGNAGTQLGNTFNLTTALGYTTTPDDADSCRIYADGHGGENRVCDTPPMPTYYERSLLRSPLYDPLPPERPIYLAPTPQTRKCITHFDPHLGSIEGSYITTCGGL